MKKTCAFLCFAVLSFVAFSQTIESVSEIDWTTKTFTSNITLDTVKSGIKMPSGKKTAATQIKTKTPELIQRPLLTLFVNNRDCLGDEVISNAITLDDIAGVIEEGKTTPEIFSHDTKKLTTTNTLNVDAISSSLIKHTKGYKPETPIDNIPSRAYSGIIIDARGLYDVHGEYVQSEVYPCFFPQIWDDEMNVIYEKNMVNQETANKKPVIKYDYSEDFHRYEEIVGYDAMYIRAVQVYGRNRTDPVIKRSDALKILTVPENIELLNKGKVVILLDKKNLLYKVAAPLKDKEYYVKYSTAKQLVSLPDVDGITISNPPPGIQFSVNLKFYPDSEKLLPGEEARIKKIAEMLSEILTDNTYTILVEGHTADVGKPIGQLNLSIDRTITVTNALIDQGFDKSIFTYKAYGGTKPIADNSTEEGRAQNRRVDITACPKATYIQRN